MNEFKENEIQNLLYFLHISSQISLAKALKMVKQQDHNYKVINFDILDDISLKQLSEESIKLRASKALKVSGQIEEEDETYD